MALQEGAGVFAHVPAEQAAAAAEAPTVADACLRILNDRHMRMDITVQQAVMSATEGTLVANAVYR